MTGRSCKFDSCPGHKAFFKGIAQMAEVVDALVSGTSIRKDVQVRVLFWALATTGPAAFLKLPALFIFAP